MNAQQIAENVPHVYRKKILLDWLPIARPDMADVAMQHLWNAWYVFVEPAGVQNFNCPVCVRNILDNWKALAEALSEEERTYGALEQIT